MAFLGSLIGGIGAAVSTVAPIVGAVQTVGSLFRGSPTQQYQANLPSSPTWNPWALRRHWQLPTRMAYVHTPSIGLTAGLEQFPRIRER